MLPPPRFQRAAYKSLRVEKVEKNDFPLAKSQTGALPPFISLERQPNNNITIAAASLPASGRQIFSSIKNWRRMFSRWLKASRGRCLFFNNT
jgi:hypothetical protein